MNPYPECGKSHRKYSTAQKCMTAINNLMVHEAISVMYGGKEKDQELQERYSKMENFCKELP
jgi:uncharacterized protein YfbU (UPF0304 family)